MASRVGPWWRGRGIHQQRRFAALGTPGRLETRNPRLGGTWVHSREWLAVGAAPNARPYRAGLPARVSELMLPVRGTVARLLIPRDASAVFGRAGAIGPRALRPDRAGSLRAFATVIILARGRSSGA